MQDANTMEYEVFRDAQATLKSRVEVARLEAAEYRRRAAEHEGMRLAALIGTGPNADKDARQWAKKQAEDIAKAEALESDARVIEAGMLEAVGPLAAQAVESLRPGFAAIDELIARELEEMRLSYQEAIRAKYRAVSLAEYGAEGRALRAAYREASDVAHAWRSSCIAQRQRGAAVEVPEPTPWLGCSLPGWERVEQEIKQYDLDMSRLARRGDAIDE
ncbi:MAG: hypothetical protein WC683_18575 [bacterium]